MKRIDLACIVDDDPIFVFGAKRLMRLTNFCKGFLVFHNGSDALDHLKLLIENGDKTPELILLDLNMPVMDGWQFLDEFIQIKPRVDVTIYIVTSSINPEDMQRAEHYKAVSNYIIKPIDEGKLREILEADTKDP